MDKSNKNSIWNRRKDRISEKEDKNIEDEMLDEEAKERKKIFWIQQRLGVSREEALRIYKNSLL